MSESSKKKLYFKPGEQKRIIDQALSTANMSVTQMAQSLNISARTLRDWRREKYRMSYAGLYSMYNRARLPLPKKLDVRDAYSHTSLAGQRGSAAVRKKYGAHFPCDPRHREQRWKQWWQKIGQHNPPPQSQPTPIHTPQYSAQLAECVGIIIGDGGITRYQVAITLNRTNDYQYAQYVSALCNKLFKIKPSIYHRPKNNTINLVFSRIELVRYLDTLGLAQGNKIKNGITIPDWIQGNERYLKKCLRGLFDTDGGLFLETHSIKSKRYSYPRLAFVSASPPLINAIYAGLTQLQFTPKIRSQKRVQLEKKDEIQRYFKIIGSSNPKHQQRFETFVRS